MGAGAVLEATRLTPNISSLIKESASWLTEGNDQWQQGWPTKRSDRLGRVISKLRDELSALEQMGQSGTRSTIELPAALVIPEHLSSTCSRATLGSLDGMHPGSTDISEAFPDLRPTGHRERQSQCQVYAEPSEGYSAFQGVLAGFVLSRGFGRPSAEDALQDCLARLFDYYDTRQPTTIQLTLSSHHTALLISTRKRLLIFALFVKSLSIRMLAHTRHAASCALAIITVFMSHRHRHEPADGWLLSRTSIQSLAGCGSR